MTPFQKRYIEKSGLGPIAEKVLARERLDRAEGLTLYRHPDLLAIGALANHVREERHGDAAYYIINQHINHTNICVAGCKFCAFYRTRRQPDAYVLSMEDVERRMMQYKSYSKSGTKRLIGPWWDPMARPIPCRSSRESRPW